MTQNPRIRQLIESFAEEIVDVVRQELLEEFTQKIQSSTALAVVPRGLAAKPRGRPKKRRGRAPHRLYSRREKVRGELPSDTGGSEATSGTPSPGQL